MKKNGLKRIVTLMAVFALLSSGIPRAVLDDKQPDILSLLSYVPVSSFASGILSYVDIPALFTGTPGAVMPDSVDGFERLVDTSAGDAVLRVYMGISAGPANVYQNLPQSREMLSSSGIDYFKIRQMLEIGSPPLHQTWLNGDFDKAAVRKSLKARDYQAMQDIRPDMEVWSKGGDIGSGLSMNLAQRDIHFPFGGSLGQSWPVMLIGDVIGATPDEGEVQAAAYGNEPSLAVQGPIADMVRAAMMTGEHELGKLAQLHLLTPSAAGTDFSISSADLSEPASGAKPLPAYALLSLSQVITAETQWVLIGLSFPDVSTAAAAVPVMRERLSRAKLARTGGLLSEQIEEFGGQTDPLFIVPGESGSHALLIPFRFPIASVTPGKDANPFRFFVNLLNSRDFGWLVIGDIEQ